MSPAPVGAAGAVLGPSAMSSFAGGIAPNAGVVGMQAL